MSTFSFPTGRVSLDRFFRLTASRKLPPGRRSLMADLARRKKILESSGIDTLNDLIHALGSAEKIRDMSDATGIPEEYLVLLAREAKSYRTRSYPLFLLPGIPFEFTEVLRSAGITSTKEFYESAGRPEDRKHLSERTGIPGTRLKELLSLCDLTRINGVGPVYARMLYHSGIRSAGEYARTDPRYLKSISDQQKKGSAPGFRELSQDEILYCVEYARVMLEYNNP